MVNKDGIYSNTGKSQSDDRPVFHASYIQLVLAVYEPKVM